METLLNSFLGIRYAWIAVFSLFTALSAVAQIPANDDCANATPLTVGTSCVVSTFSNVNATSEAVSVAPNPTCGYYQGSDVWFTAVMPASGLLRIEAKNLNGATPYPVTIYSGTCGNFTQVLCYQLDNDKIINEPSLAGQTLYLRLYTYSSSVGHEFTLCVFEPTLPVNDACENALPLTVGTSCESAQYSNLYALSDSPGTAPSPSCGFYKGGDVWFTAVMPASGNLRIEASTVGSSTEPSITVYSGSCGTFEEVACVFLDPGKLISAPEFAGQTLYLRVFTYNSEEGRAFNICLHEPVVPVNDDCENAIALTVGTSCQNQNYSNAYALPQSINIAPNPTCGFYKGSDVWFTAVMPASGALRIEAKVIGKSIAPSFSIYSGSCGNFEEIGCAVLDQGKLIVAPEHAGETIYIRVFSFNDEEGYPFTICLYEPDVQVNDHCENAIALPVGVNCQPQTFSNAYTTSQPETVAPVPSCNFYKGGDVWFTAQMPASGVLRAEINTIGRSIAPSVTVYTGSCGAFTEIACFNLNNKPLLADPSLAGQTLYFRVYSFNNEEGYPFTICLYDPGCVPIIAAASRSICEGENFSFGTQILTEAGQYSQTFEAANLCDSLVYLTLTTHPVYYRQDTVTVCYESDFTFPDGTVAEAVTEPVSHISELFTVHQCDSVIETYIAVHFVNTSVTQNGNQLTALADPAEFQWLDCDNGSEPVSGATGAVFTPTKNGTYAVRVTENNCIDTSACFAVIVLDTIEDSAEPFEIYPNPASQYIFINLKGDAKNGTVELVNTLGQLWWVQEAGGRDRLVVHADQMPSGLYLMRVVTKGHTWVAKQLMVR